MEKVTKVFEIFYFVLDNSILSFRQIIKSNLEFEKIRSCFLNEYFVFSLMHLICSLIIRWLLIYYHHYNFH